MQHSLSVGELAGFWRSGDINFRFTGRSTAIEGIRGHQQIQKKRGYVAEKPVLLMVRHNGYEIEVQGRVDGFDDSSTPPMAEEIKTLRVPVSDLPDAVRDLHLAQLRLYGHLLCEMQGFEWIRLRLCYLNLNDDSETLVEKCFSRSALARFFDQSIDRLVRDLHERDRWCTIRNESIAKTDFPYSRYRPGQREMAVSVYRALAAGRQTVLQAPTGIGKTMATLFPSVKALPETGVEKIVYVSAKTSGQEMAGRSMRELLRAGFQVRGLILTAKDRICFNPGSPCDPEHCAYARGYYDRLQGAMEDALDQHRFFGRQDIEILARRHGLCPFEFALDLSRMVDVLICDYNYVFDPVVGLRRYFGGEQGNCVLLVDEAHNLVDRGREMFSASVHKQAFLSLGRQLKPVSSLLARRIARVNAAFLALKKGYGPSLMASGHACPGGSSLDRIGKVLRRFCEAAEEFLKDPVPGAWQPALLRLYFDALHFLRTLEQMDGDYTSLLTRQGTNLELKLCCINPAKRLSEGFSRMKTSICFSATMNPKEYFQTLLGLDEEAQWYRIPSPFDPGHLGVCVASWIDTTWRGRSESLQDLVSLIDRIVSVREGNYLVFFPSHAYLQAASERYRVLNPQREVVVQQPSMSEEDRMAYLERFVPAGRVTGFAVMGGVFGEAVDLPGERLVGVIIAGVGLPALSAERDLIRDFWREAGTGFEFAYQYPGMNRVLQTAGRVIRTPDDRGIVCLVDTRFASARYRRMFPAEWRVQVSGSIRDLTDTLSGFWAGDHRTLQYRHCR